MDRCSVGCGSVVVVEVVGAAASAARGTAAGAGALSRVALGPQGTVAVHDGACRVVETRGRAFLWTACRGADDGVFGRDDAGGSDDPDGGFPDADDDVAADDIDADDAGVGVGVGAGVGEVDGGAAGIGSGGGGRRSGALGDPRSGRELRGGGQRDAAGGPRRQQDQRDGLGRDQSRRQRPARLRRSDEGRLRRARPGERGPGGGLTRDLLGPARGGRRGEEPRHRRVGGVAVEQRLGGGAVQPGGSSAHLAPPSAVLRPAVTRHARRASWPAA